MAAPMLNFGTPAASGRLRVVRELHELRGGLDECRAHGQRIVLVLFHAQSQSLDAPQSQIGIERAGDAAHSTAHRCHALTQFLVGDNIKPAHDIGMTTQIFCG